VRATLNRKAQKDSLQAAIFAVTLYKQWLLGSCSKESRDRDGAQPRELVLNFQFIALALLLIAVSASPAAELSRFRCHEDARLFSNLDDTKRSIALQANQGQECSIGLWDSSEDGDSWIETVNPRVAQPPSHGLVEAIGEPAHDLSNQRAARRVGDDRRETRQHRRSLFIAASKSSFTYRPEPGYVGADHFVLEIDLLQDDIAATATIDVEVAVLSLAASWAGLLRESGAAIGYVCAVGPKEIAVFVSPDSYCARHDGFTIEQADDGVSERLYQASTLQDSQFIWGGGMHGIVAIAR
jgi:hypothetical protein